MEKADPKKWGSSDKVKNPWAMVVPKGLRVVAEAIIMGMGSARVVDRGSDDLGAVVVYRQLCAQSRARIRRGAAEVDKASLIVQLR